MRAPEVVQHDRLLRDPVIHIRRMRGGTGNPEASITEGPVETAANEIVRDLINACRLEVRRTSATRLKGTGAMVRATFEVDVVQDGEVCTWDHLIVAPTYPYRRLPEGGRR